MITSTFSAHPKVDLATGELVNIGWAVNGLGGDAVIRYDIIDADGQPPRPSSSRCRT